MTSNESKETESVARAGASKRLVISVDAMGGDRGPAAVVAGVAAASAADPSISFILHGDEAVVRPLLDQYAGLSAAVELRHAARVVTMEDKPSQVMRNGAGTSMWSTIEAVRGGEASAAVSCGNTGALMAVSMIRLRRIPGINRPAIACLWPSRNPGGFNVLLDVGADVKADPEDLLQYALMGTSYARNGFGLERPRVGILNVGTEEHKGRAEVKAAHDLIQGAAVQGEFEFVGFVEGSDISGARADVIVTDGFTGNIALKTGEGTAKFVGEILKSELSATILSKLSALLAMGSLKRMAARIDPRRVNGGVFLGLNGTVVKSHGSADATGVEAAIGLAVRLARAGFIERLAARIATAQGAGQEKAAQGEGASS